jgi:hypothetical protein
MLTSDNIFCFMPHMTYRNIDIIHLQFYIGEISLWYLYFLIHTHIQILLTELYAKLITPAMSDIVKLLLTSDLSLRLARITSWNSQAILSFISYICHIYMIEKNNKKRNQNVDIKLSACDTFLEYRVNWEIYNPYVYAYSILLHITGKFIKTMFGSSLPVWF